MLEFNMFVYHSYRLSEIKCQYPSALPIVYERKIKINRYRSINGINIIYIFKAKLRELILSRLT